MFGSDLLSGKQPVAQHSNFEVDLLSVFQSHLASAVLFYDGTRLLTPSRLLKVLVGNDCDLLERSLWATDTRCVQNRV